jgi:hypothetical protein
MLVAKACAPEYQALLIKFWYLFIKYVIFYFDKEVYRCFLTFLAMTFTMLIRMPHIRPQLRHVFVFFLDSAPGSQDAGKAAAGHREGRHKK